MATTKDACSTTRCRVTTTGIWRSSRTARTASPPPPTRLRRTRWRAKLPTRSFHQPTRSDSALHSTSPCSTTKSATRQSVHATSPSRPSTRPLQNSTRSRKNPTRTPLSSCSCCATTSPSGLRIPTPTMRTSVEPLLKNSKKGQHQGSMNFLSGLLGAYVSFEFWTPQQAVGFALGQLPWCLGIEGSKPPARSRQESYVSTYYRLFSLG